MRVEELAPEVLGLGTPVFYSHRAASVKRAIDTDLEGRQVAQDYGVISTADASTRGRVPASLRAHDGVANVLPNPSPPRRQPVREPLTIGETTYPAHVGEPYELDRWVYVWPEEGQGKIVGLVFRQEGRWDEFEGGEYGANGYVSRYLIQTESWPLYEVKARLTAKAILVPVWAACTLVDVGDRYIRNEGFVAETNSMHRRVRNLREAA